MSIPTLSELLTSQTGDEVFGAFVQALVNLGIPADKWRPGGVASTMLRIVAITYAGFTQLMVAALSAQFLPYATGNWLTLLAYYVYGVIRIPATSASTPCTLTNSGGGIYDYGIGQFTVKNAVTGITFTNQAVFHLGAVGSGADSVTVSFVASVAGTAGNSNPGDINELVTTANGVSVTNPAAAVGLDQQSDPDLRTACTNSLAQLSVRTPRNAYKYAITSAINAVTGLPVAINRVQVIDPGTTYVGGIPVATPGIGSPGMVSIWAASPSGAPTSSDMAAAGANIEKNARGGAVNVSLNAVTTVPYTRTLTVYARALPGVTAAALQTAAGAALATFFSTYPIGGLATDNPIVPQGMFGTGIAGVIASTNPAIFFVEDTINPGKAPPDLALSNGQVATDSITLIVRLVPSS